MEKAKGAPGNQYTGPPRSRDVTGGQRTLADLGISKPQSSRWQKLAGIPEDDFEASLAAPGKPSTAGIIAEYAEPSRSPVLPNALWIWGRLLDWERNGLLDDEDALAYIASANLNRRHLTKGQQAMALAMIYPDGGKGGRGNTGNPAETAAFSERRLRDARALLRHSRAIAEDVLADRMKLDAALQRMPS